MTTFQQGLREELVRRNYSPTTIRSYVHALATCEQYHRRRRIDRLGPNALRRYQAHLFDEKKPAVGTVGLHVAALRFFFVRVPKRRELKEDLPTPNRHRHPQLSGGRSARRSPTDSMGRLGDCLRRDTTLVQPAPEARRPIDRRTAGHRRC